MANPYRFALIGKFSSARPQQGVILQAFSKLALASLYNICFLRSGYIFIHLTSGEDMARVWMRGIWFISGVPLCIFKWSPNFSYEVESSVVPVWIQFPDLPIQMFSKCGLFVAASVFGRPLKVDEATVDGSRLSVARVCVEIDLLKPKVDEFWIGIGTTRRIQKVVFEKQPKYCIYCFHLGHGMEDCYVNGNKAKPNWKSASKVNSVGDVGLKTRMARKDNSGRVEVSDDIRNNLDEGNSQDQRIERQWVKKKEDKELVDGGNREVTDLVDGHGNLCDVGISADSLVSEGVLNSEMVQGGAKDNVVGFVPQRRREIEEMEVVESSGLQRVASLNLVLSDHNKKTGIDTGQIPSKRVMRSLMVRNLGMNSGLSNCNGKIWFFYDDSIGCTILEDNEQFLHLNLNSFLFPVNIFVTIVYAKCSYIERRTLWEKLLEVTPVMEEVWMVGGDFNVILSSDEHSAGILNNPGAVKEFNDFVMLAGLIDTGFVGDKFTWTNLRIWKRLDRVLISSSWNVKDYGVRIEHLNRATSDHCPLLISFPSISPSVSSFRFQRMWINHPNFELTVRLNWFLPCSCVGLKRLQFKLQRLKDHLKWWNAYVFGNIQDKVKQAEMELYI
ncbi:uncharacterized protein LOC122035343 [Zingiber officinale]|uniref:uncharacterized protein LOC122035343 n=1 Tax=Zingiber officinale TaxID=94328 RepID=UPI001C4B6AED|nr:uncharacterized protein LOC122035343 [Zingiber officinale]